MDEMLGRDMCARSARWDHIFLNLASEKPTFPHRPQQFLRCTLEVSKIAFFFAGHLHANHMVEIIGPNRVATISTFFTGSHDSTVIARILTDDPAAALLPFLGNLLHQMFAALIRDSLGSV